MKNIKPWPKIHTLPRLDLELLHAGALRRRLGILVLVISIMLAAAAFTYYQYIVRQGAVLETSIAMPVIKEDDALANGKEAEAVQAAIVHLALPWGSLFTALETTVTDKVSIISIEPDISKSSVKIVAESLDVFEMLEYFRALQQQPALRDVQLTGYEVRLDATDQPVRFTLTALWAQTP